MVKKSLFTVFVILIIVTITMSRWLPSSNEPTDIRLGASLPLSGINQNLGNEIVSGASMYFKYINDHDGISGKKINFIYYDDKYEPEITQSNIHKLIKEDDVFALFDFVGTPTVKSILPIILKSDIPFIAPYTGAKFLRNSQIPNIVNLRSSYEEEIDALVTHLNREKNVTRISIFYQNDEYGKEGYIATLKALKKRKLSLMSEGTYKRNTLFTKQAIYDIRSPIPEAIILVGAYKPTARFIQKAREDSQLKKAIYCPISFVNSDALMKELDYNSKNIIFSQTVPSYTQNNDNAKEYRALIQRYSPDSLPTFASFESYLAAKAVIKALEACDGNINRKRFLYQLKHLKKNALGNLDINYQDSQLLNKVYLLKYSNSKFETIGIKK
jgi:ABC-type branched-subunit amino acid transport system substrate-binding protein